MNTIEYNTTRDKLKIREYGRNIQKLITFAIAIEDKTERTQFCHFIIQVMSQIQTQKDGSDFKRKLWDHMHIISDFKLDVDSPFEVPTKTFYQTKPEPIEYKEKNLRFKQYGNNIEKIIEKAIEFEEGPEKETLIKIIANHLKKLYLHWNRESVNDDLINEHLKILSGGKLKLSEDFTYNSTGEILSRLKRRKVTQTQSNQKSSNQRHSHGSSNKRRSNTPRPRTNR